MIRRPPRSTQSRSSAASDVYKRQGLPGKRKRESLLHGDFSSLHLPFLHHDHLIHDQAESQLEKFCGAAAKQHAGDENLKVFHWWADLRVDGDIQRNESFLFINQHIAMFHRKIHSVMNIEGS